MNHELIIHELNLRIQHFEDKGNTGEVSFLEDLRNIVDESKWIPVSERLPEEAGEYLCFVGGQKIILWYYSGLNKFGRSDMTDFDFKWVTEAITHWKPLPNVPEDV